MNVRHVCAFICYSQCYSSDDLVLVQFVRIDEFFCHTAKLTPVVPQVMTIIIHYDFSTFDFDFHEYYNYKMNSHYFLLFCWWYTDTMCVACWFLCSDYTTEQIIGLTIFGTEFFACKCDLCDLLFIWFWCVVCLLLLLHINLLKILTFDYDYPIKRDTIILSFTRSIYASDSFACSFICSFYSNSI